MLPPQQTLRQEAIHSDDAIRGTDDDAAASRLYVPYLIHTSAPPGQLVSKILPRPPKEPLAGLPWVGVHGDH
jgi:hypothetical protein